MKTFKFEELLEYINNQPDDRMVYMGSGSNRENDSDCCVMSHFCKDKLKNKFSVVYTNGSICKFREPVGIIELPVPSIFACFNKSQDGNNLKTYKDLKSNLKKQFRVTKTQE